MDIGANSINTVITKVLKVLFRVSTPKEIKDTSIILTVIICCVLNFILHLIHVVSFLVALTLIVNNIIGA